MDAFLPQGAFNHMLRGNTCMVSARNPERTRTGHALVADNDILQHRIETVPHMEYARYIWRWDSNDKGTRTPFYLSAMPIAPLAIRRSTPARTRAKCLPLLPACVDTRFKICRPIDRRQHYFLQFLGHNSLSSHFTADRMKSVRFFIRYMQVSCRHCQPLLPRAFGYIKNPS